MNLARAAARLLAVTCVLGLTAAPASAAELDLESLDGPTAVKLMEEGKLTSVELTRYPTAHYEIYTGEWFERAVTRQAEFLARHLN